jgi:hypothetical protein
MKTLREPLRTGISVTAQLTPAFFERELGAAACHGSRPEGMATAAAAKPIKWRLVMVLNGSPNESLTMF